MKKIILLIILMMTSLGFSQDPATGPTDPSARNAWDVKSLYSGIYTNEPSVIFDTFGDGAASISDVTLNDSNVVSKYLGHRYSGISAGAGDLNVTAMTNLHLDVYSPDASFVSSFRIKLEAVNGSNVELAAPASPTRTTGNWISYDIDLSNYSAVDLAHLKWIVPVSTATWPTGITMYIDNVYFWRPATSLPSSIISGFSVPTKSNGSAPFTITQPTSNSTGAFSYASSNTNVATISGNTITIVGIGQTTITATQAATASFGAGSTTATFNVTPPAAPAPTASSANVIPIYTDGYPLVEAASVITYRTDWSAAALTSIVIPRDNNTLLYSNVNYFGIDTSPIDASGMNLFHIDIYTPNMTTFRLKLVDFGANGSYGGGDDSEHELSMTPSLNGWNSYNLLLSSFTNLAARAHISQIVMSGNPAGSGTLYVDNMYFANETITVAPALSNFTIPAKVTGDADFAISAPTSTSNGAFTYTSSNTSVATIVGGSSIHIVGIGTTTITATQAASGNYTSGTISANFVVTAPIAQAPTTAAPTPPSRNAWDVVSLFSGSYSNATLNELPTDWSQLSEAFEVLSVDGNSTWKFKGEFLGMVTNYGSGVNLSQMTTMHIDYWTPDANRIDLKLVNTVAGGEAFTALEDPTVAGTWRSIDVPLSNYGSLNRSNITQLLIDPAGVSKVYIDNFYFYRPATSLPSPTLSNFTVSNKVLGDAAFSLTTPTSNSTGTFTYTSSNTSVATISGTTVTIVGAGTSVISANQAASASYGAGTISANLIVSYPPPATAAPTPTVPADRVISLYSNAYTNVSGTDWFPNWGQSTMVSDIQVSGNDTKKYELLNYQGVQLANPIDVSSMTTMHVDIWTPNCTTFEVFLVNQAPPAGQVGFSGEQSVSLSPTQSGWNSFDIPMSSYSTLELNHIQQLKLVATPFGSTTAYLDNIYFTKPTPTSVAPTVADVNYCKGSVASPLTASGYAGNALKWYTVTTNATTGVNTYAVIAAGAPTPLTSTVGTKKYAVSQVLSNGVESSKAIISVNILALPTEILGTITSNTAGTTAGTYAAATLAVGQYVGTSTQVSYRIPPFTGTGLTYYWTVPAGVNIVSQTDNVLTVNFLNVTSGIGAVGSITVQAQNANGCRTAAKSIALSKVLPTAPAGIKMTDDSIAVPATGIPVAVTSFAKYMGTNKVLTLTATPSATATSYVWELPTGVNQLSGGSSNVITVNFLGVTSSNSFNYSTTTGVSTNVLRIGVKSRNGVGDSTTSNATAVSPTTTSTAKLLTLTAVKPAAITAVAGQIAGLCGGNTYTYTISDSALASSYTVVAPAGAVVNFTSTLVFTVTYPAGFTVNTTTTVPNKSLVITSVNGMGSSVATKTITLSTAMAAVGVVSGGTTYSSCNQTFSIPAVVGASTYTWTVPAGASIVSGQGTTSVVVNYGSLAGSQTIKVLATNACGVSSALKSVTLTSGACPIAKQSELNNALVNEVKLYPNPATNVFNVELNASTDTQMEMAVYSMNGSLVNSKNIQVTEGNNTITEDISSLSTGIYFVKFTNVSSNETIIKKLIKE